MLRFNLSSSHMGLPFVMIFFCLIVCYAPSASSSADNPSSRPVYFDTMGWPPHVAVTVPFFLWFLSFSSPGCYCHDHRHCKNPTITFSPASSFLLALPCFINLDPWKKRNTLAPSCWPFTTRSSANSIVDKTNGPCHAINHHHVSHLWWSPTALLAKSGKIRDLPLSRQSLSPFPWS